MEEVFVCKSEEMADGDRRLIKKGQVEVGVFRIGDQFVAWHNRCAHQGGPVCQGRVFPKVLERLGEDRISAGFCYSEDAMHIVCPWHGYEYDLRTGRNSGNPGLGLRAAEVILRDRSVYVRI